MPEEAQLLRLARAFTKIRSPQTKREIVEFVEAAREFEEAFYNQEISQKVVPGNL
ncbi:MAG TPA: hypothetical protein VFA15_07630 [Nitrososphaera sp.]|nr:hypothetical protein [Nitrososphaera sp.]